jgi:uncharacterized membrane protein
MSFLKTTIIGGLVFLVPLVVLVLVIGEAIGLVLVVAEPMATFLPIDSVAGVALANLIAAVIVLLVCFLAGLLARSALAQRLKGAAESTVLQKIPGYTFLKGITSTLSPHENADLKPALVSMGTRERIGLEVERVGDDRVVVYLPNSPNAWSGIVQIVSAKQVKPIELHMMSVMEHAEQMGRGTAKILAGESPAK